MAQPTDRFHLSLPLKWELLGFVLIFALLTFLRFNHLSADPPNKISFSQDIETDPPQYTVFARSAVQEGNWNPYADHRYVTYEYSLVSATARLVYGVLGVGTYQANLVGLLLTVASILLFYFVVRKGLGNGTALLALLFIGINFLGIFFGRRPFLETGMNLLFILGLFSLTYWDKRAIGHFLFGVCFASAVVFGKIIALGFLGLPVVYYLYRGLYLDDRQAWIHAAWAAGGFALLTGVWYLLIFRPNAAMLTGYVSEQAFGLYGAPEGLKSISKFVWKFLSFGKDSEFFDRMPSESLAAVVVCILLAGQLFVAGAKKTAQETPRLVLVMLAAWLISTYVSQMPWNYQPVRYQTAMIFPLGALAAAGIAYILNCRQAVGLFKASIPFAITLFVLVLLAIYQLTASVAVDMGVDFTFKEYFPYVAIPVLAVVAGYYLLSRKMEAQTVRLPAVVRYGCGALVVLVALWFHGKNYLAWADNPLYTTRQASRDLGLILSPGAVISGPYAPALALENNLGCVINIFGTTRPDSLMFRRYPITHLILEHSNEEVARQLYPQIMDKARLVCHYYVNCRKVSIYRIARITGNPRAAEYLLSNFEMANRFYDRNLSDSGDVYLQRFLKLNPENISGNLFAGFFALSRGLPDSAVTLFTRAMAFSPTDFNLHYLLGKAYLAKADSSGDDAWRFTGQHEIDLATRYDLGYHDFDDYIGDYVKDSTNGSIIPGQ
jgi:4-amino-4-deoxy-L-arabinose transferase-like glycosyltransferase